MDSMQGNYRIYIAGSAIFTYSKQSCRNLKERNAKGNRQGTLRKEGAPGRLLYLSLISSLKRCSPLWLRRFLFVALGEVLLEGFFHLLRGQLVENAHAAVTTDIVSLALLRLSSE